ncbi:P-loop containing nucleoside triphosphate hydrolases superfamily protein [Tasmannia lanceolata]|uniref:P-loop containing nucleoside triphosphate hydrolases superfamily protein n=1 Tax=Tasmannia lanceolata TaxID=3420 RepID=UPI0040632F08
MDMEMDIPLPEELEWLESNADFEDEEEDFFPEEQFPEPSTTVSGTFTLPKISPIDFSSHLSDLSPAQNPTPRKRLWSDKGDFNASGREANEKRNRTVSETETETETDEDWLRYSPRNSDADTVIVEDKFISRFASEIEGDCISVTGPDGDRVYAKMSRGEMKDDVKRLNVERPIYGKSLLSEPINVLMERMEQEALTKALQASTGSPNDLVEPPMQVVSEQLWVDKYAPHSFTELLSDEQTNREVLLWLKQWDSCVFGSQIRSTADDVLSSLRRHSSFVQQKKFSDSKSSFSKNKGAPLSNQTFKQSNGFNQKSESLKGISELWNKKSLATDPSGQKVLLLCGPPGLGKTTLAHVAAKHCGYRVVEINASDDRSSSTIESKILDVVQMNSVMADSRPKCLVIDEIDGALGEGKGAVEVILKMVAGDKKSVAGKNVDQESQPGMIASKRGRKVATLSRPVICICNDLFAPALRQLRQVAKVHTFVQPTISRVVNRLKYICNKEGFKTSGIALTALAEYTECDIRSCLNTLQFLNKKKQTINILEVGSQVVGRKDMSRSAFDVWKEIFQRRKVKHERRSMNSCSSVPKDFDFLYSLISNRGEYELTMDGVHENFLQLHYHDPMMQKTVKCLNVLGISDTLVQYIMRTQQTSLYAYQPSIAINIRSLIAQVEYPNIEWPKSFQRYRAMFMEKKDLLKLWHNKISPSISRHLSIEYFVEDAVSSLLAILSPPTLRPVALQLLSEREKDDLNQLVDTMVSYSITYKNAKPERQPDAQRHEAPSEAPSLSFDPPIYDFVNFKDYHCGHSGLSLAMKQVLVHEVEKQKILRESIGRSIHSNDGKKSEDLALPMEEIPKALAAETNYTTVPKATSTQRQWKADASTTSVLGSNKSTTDAGMKLKSSGDVKKPSRASSCSFFDRFRKSNKSSHNPDDSLQKQATLERDSRPLLFKFNEGFTNAVKRPVRIRELLL